MKTNVMITLLCGILKKKGANELIYKRKVEKCRECREQM